MAYSAEKTLRDNADKVPADLKTEVEGKIAAVRTALQGTEIEPIRTALEELNTSLQKIGQAVYGQQGAGQDGAEAQEPQGTPEGTVEGEFREV
jgi:molecular chaperone DnaK